MSPTMMSKNLKVKVNGKDWYDVKDITLRMNQLNDAWQGLTKTGHAATTSTTAYVTTYQNTGTTTNGVTYNPIYNNPSYTARRVAVPPGQTYVDVITPHYSTDYDTDPAPRRPPPREFNRYLNASDLLEEFIEYLGSQGVRASEFMTLPVELFVKWLIIRACEHDQETPNVTLALPPAAHHRHHARCLGCGRYMRTAPVALHEPCAPRYFARHPTPKEKLCVPTLS